jgi:ABC-type phosphate transport system substrate-binding protein
MVVDQIKNLKKHLGHGRMNLTIKIGNTPQEKVLKTIKRIEGSIGYGILGWEQAEAEGVRVLGVEGRLPTEQNVRDGLYPFTRPHLLVSRGSPKGIVKMWKLAFISFAVQRPPSKERQ